MTLPGGGFALIFDDRLIATGDLEHVLSAGVDAGCVAEEHYEARRTGDEVVRRKPVGGARIIPAAWLDREVRRAA